MPLRTLPNEIRDLWTRSEPTLSDALALAPHKGSVIRAAHSLQNNVDPRHFPMLWSPRECHYTLTTLLPVDDASQAVPTLAPNYHVRTVTDLIDSQSQHLWLGPETGAHQHNQASQIQK